MNDLLKNLFIQCLGVLAATYLTLLGLNWAIMFFLRILETFSRWYRYHAFPYAFQISLGLTLAYLVIVGVFSSKRN